MQTKLSPAFLNTPQGQEADDILRACVHCGFCTATCPTYQLLGDELDSPRGRIYLIKQMLEGAEVTTKTRTHLDRCLTCRSCETTCPSGVRYGRLVDIGREIVEDKVPRNLLDKAQRLALRKVLPYPERYTALNHVGQHVRTFLPRAIKQKIPPKQAHIAWPKDIHSRSMLVLEGCAQKALTPITNSTTARVLDKLGIALLREPKAGCCGALSYHLSAHEEGLDFMRRNIDAWWPYVNEGIEAIVMTASGCGSVVKEYGELLKHDPEYAEMAAHISALAKDISEVLYAETLPEDALKSNTQKVAFHSPCTLQHGQQINGMVEGILQQCGYQLTTVTDAHLCCGSAGTYSILQKKLSRQLRQNKRKALKAGKPDIIATANIGCQLQLAEEGDIPIKHWIELVDACLK